MYTNEMRWHRLFVDIQSGASSALRKVAMVVIVVVVVVALPIFVVAGHSTEPVAVPFLAWRGRLPSATCTRSETYRVFLRKRIRPASTKFGHSRTNPSTIPVP